MRRDEVRQRLTEHTSRPVTTAGLRSAAVLVPLQPAGEDYNVVLTRRAATLHQHAGQIAFPGGRIDPGDVSAEAAACRETFEELGVPASAITPFARLDEIVAITGYHIIPVVAEISADVTYRVSAAEVARVFSVPLNLLLDARGWQQHSVPWRPEYATQFSVPPTAAELKIWRFLHDGEDIWGVTGAILRGLVELLW